MPFASSYQSIAQETGLSVFAFAYTTVKPGTVKPSYIDLLVSMLEMVTLEPQMRDQREYL